MIAAFANLNWLPVAVASLVYYLLGAAWFTPLFGKTWDRSIGHDRSRASRFRLDYYLVPLLSATLVSLTLAVVIAALAPDDLGEVMLIGLVVGLGVATPVSITNALTPHTPHPYLFGALTGGYHFVGVVMASAIIGAF